MVFSLNQNTMYQVRVRTNLTTEWGPLRYFTTGTYATLSYVTSPAHGAVNIATTVNVTASAIPGATDYTIELNTSMNFDGVSFVQSGTGTTRTFTFSGLAYYTYYYSRVRHSLLAPGEWGATKAFRTRAASLSGARQLQEPHDTPIEVTEETTLISLYPNPAGGSVNIQLAEEARTNVPVKLFDLTGHLLIEDFVSPGERSKTLNTGKFTNGVYLVQIEYGNAIIRKKLFIKR